jgi:hypothetical protein
MKRFKLRNEMVSSRKLRYREALRLTSFIIVILDFGGRLPGRLYQTRSVKRSTEDRTSAATRPINQLGQLIPLLGD